MVDCKSQEGIIVWLVRAVNPAAASGSWENVVEHGAYLAAGDVRMSTIHFGLTKPQAAASLWPCRSTLISIHPHPTPGDPPVPPARPSAGGCSPGCFRTTTSLCNLPCTRAPLPCSEKQYSHRFYVLQENSFW